MKVIMVGHDFDFSAGDGISRYSSEIYRGVDRRAEVRTISVGNLPRSLRVLRTVNARGADIVHLMYPDVAKVDKGKAKMVVMWHDNRVFSKYAADSQHRSEPTLSERFGIAKWIVRKWATANYLKSSAIICNSSQTLSELRTYFSSRGLFNPRKIYRVIPLAIGDAFIRTRVWRGDRKDFGYVGSIHLRHKNLIGLLAAFDRIAEGSGAKLHIFTSSPNAAGILNAGISMFEGLSSDNVVLHYRASDSEVLKYLPKLVAYVHLSKEEGLGLPILEAIAAGTNAVVLKEAKIPEEVRRHAISVPERSVADELLKLMASPRPAPAKAVAYARSFTWKRIVDDTLAVYEEVLSGKRQS
jgi:glycosyltransferase involved in cell wall biosynthesis